MTIPSTPRKAGPFTGNGVQTAWPFTFKVFAEGDVKVTVGDTTGAESVLVLNTDYTVTLNANQETSPGGAITYLLANGYKLTVTGDIDYDQPLDLPTGGNFNPIALENQLDRATIQIQQLAEQMVRAVKVPVTDDGTGELSGDLAQGILALAPAVADVTAVAGGLPQVTTVSANITDVNTVAGNIADVTNFADVYLGPSASDPTTRTDGSPLQIGDLYFNTAVDRTRIYGVAGWADVGTATPVTVATQEFSGNGSQTTFTLSAAPAFEAACDVYIAGVAQKVDVDYNISGTSLVFTSAPPLGTGNIYVKILSAYAGGVPNDGSVTPAKVVPGTYDIDISGNAATATTATTATTAGNVSGTVAIANGGTGQTDAASAFNAIKQSASETATGVVELATNAEAQAFTAGKVIDGAKLAQALMGANQSLAANGYQKLPGGLIVQWGTTGSIPLTSSAAQTFPIAFPNAFLGIATSARTQGSTHYADTGSLTGFTLFNTSGVACVFSYIAIGY